MFNNGPSRCPREACGKESLQRTTLVALMGMVSMVSKLKGLSSTRRERRIVI